MERSKVEASTWLSDASWHCGPRRPDLSIPLLAQHSHRKTLILNKNAIREWSNHIRGESQYGVSAIRKKERTPSTLLVYIIVEIEYSLESRD